MRKIILFGNVPLATWVAKQIVNANNIELLGVVCDKYERNYFKHHGMEEVSLFSYAKEKKNKNTYIRGFVSNCL